MKFAATPDTLAGLRNLGPKSAAALAQIGIRTRSDLAKVGAVGAYIQLQEAGWPVSRNLCYAIEGAHMDADWRALPSAFKRQIDTEVARYKIAQKQKRRTRP